MSIGCRRRRRKPGILRDDVPEERQQGIDAGLAWAGQAEATVVYTDRGISRVAATTGQAVEVRSCWPDLTEAEVALIAFEAILSDEEPPERPKGRPTLGR
jgi:hypothetical protein